MVILYLLMSDFKIIPMLCVLLVNSQCCMLGRQWPMIWQAGSFPRVESLVDRGPKDVSASVNRTRITVNGFTVPEVQGLGVNLTPTTTVTMS